MNIRDLAEAALVLACAYVTAAAVAAILSLG